MNVDKESSKNGVRSELCFHEIADQEKMANFLEFSDMTTSRAVPRSKKETTVLDLSSSTTKPAKKPEKCPSNPVDNFAVQFRDIFRVPILLMCLGGLQLPKRSIGNSSQKATASCRLCSYLLKVHQLFISLLHLTNIVKLVIACVRLIPRFQMIDRASFLIEVIQMTFYTVLFVSENVAMHFYFNSLMVALENYNQAFAFLSNLSKWKRRVTGISLFSAFCLAGGALTIATHDEIGIVLTNPFTSQVRNVSANILPKIVAGIQYFLLICPVAGTVSLYTFLVCVICEEFKLTAVEVRQALANYDHTASEEQLNYNRERYQCLCRVINILSRLTRTLILEHFLFTTAIIFLFIYGLADWDSRSTKDVFCLIFGMFINLCMRVSLAAKWGQLPVAASSILEALADANWFLLPAHLVHKIGTFMTQCYGQKIAVDVFGLFKVDSSTPLMVIGTTLTYGIVVMQFSFNKEDVACDCRHNCSST